MVCPIKKLLHHDEYFFISFSKIREIIEKNENYTLNKIDHIWSVLIEPGSKI